MVENVQFFSKCSEYINMHQNASKCMQNELCKGFVHEIIKELVLITFKGAKIDEIHFPLYGGSPCSNAQTDGVYLYFNDGLFRSTTKVE